MEQGLEANYDRLIEFLTTNKGQILAHMDVPIDNTLTDGEYVTLLELLSRAAADLSCTYIDTEFLYTTRTILEDVLIARRHLTNIKEGRA